MSMLKGEGPLRVHSPRSMRRIASLLAIGVTVISTSPAAAQPRPRGGGPAARVPPGVTAHRDLAYVVDGHERQKLDLFVPEKSDGPLPLIIWIHGGGWQNGSKDGCPPLRNGFTERGYAVASINYRLSGHAVFPAQIEDCKAAIRWLRAHAKDYRLDPQRFGVWGSSAGGHLAALVGTSGDVKAFDVGPHLDQSSRVQAVCDYFGPTDFMAFVSTPGYERHATANSPEARLLGGPVAKNKDEAVRASPVTYVSRDDPAFLIVHGDKDPVVPINQSQLLHDALERAGVNSHFHTIKGGGHGQGFGGPEMESMVGDFFDRVLEARSLPANPGPAAPSGDFQLDGERWTYREGEFVMSGILVKPEGEGPFPAVLISHGLGGSAESFGLTKAREMVRWGFVCIAPSYTHSVATLGNRPGSPHAGPPPRAARGGQQPADYGASEENLRRGRTCLELVGRMPEVDANRLYAYGHSMGGFVTIGLAAIEPDRLQAAAITGSGIAPAEGFPAPSAAMAERVRTPFLILHGGADPVVRPRQSADFKAILDENRVPNERTLYDGEGHPIDQTQRERVFAAVRAWFEKHGAK